MIWCDRFDMMWYDMMQYDMIWYDAIWCDTIWYDIIWHDMIMIWHNMIRYGVTWYMIEFTKLTEWWPCQRKMQLCTWIVTETDIRREGRLNVPAGYDVRPK